MGESLNSSGLAIEPLGLATAYKYPRVFLRCSNFLLLLFTIKDLSLPDSDKKAPSFFCPLPMITAERLEELYTVHGVDRAVVVDLASTTESPEAVCDGYGGAYLSFFGTCGLSFPIPKPVLSVLVELGLSLTQMCPNFLRHLLALLVKAREEGLLFGLDELRHLVLMKRNNQNLGTLLMSPL